MRKMILTIVCVLGLTAEAQTSWSYGGHVYTMKGTLTAEAYDKNATGVVTFTNVPSDYQEFEALYTQCKTIRGQWPGLK